MVKRLAVVILTVGLAYSKTARAQGSYRNLDAGLPVRIEDATVTERYERGRSVDGRLNSVAVE